MELAGQTLPKVLLVGNYLLDEQESMVRYCHLMAQLLKDKGFPVRLIHPQVILGSKKHGALSRWTGYLDKYVLFPAKLKMEIAQADVVHILDHSNAVYVPYLSGKANVVTCHDLLAVRAGLGEETYCPISTMGKLLQRWILHSLAQAKLISCISKATACDAKRLLNRTADSVRVVYLGPNFPYQIIDRQECHRRLCHISGLQMEKPYILNVGSSQPRKNRDGIMRIFAMIKDQFPGQLVFAGSSLTADLWQLADTLGIRQRVLEVTKPDETTLEALYNCAFAMLFPSKSEGFGWPIPEAQACGCPVLASNVGPCPEAAGDAAFLHDFSDEKGFAQSILSLQADQSKRKSMIAAGLLNAASFSNEIMVQKYIGMYQEVMPAGQNHS